VLGDLVTMKINDVLNEGPLDFARKVGAGIKGAVQGAKQGNKDVTGIVPGAIAGGAQAMQRSQQQADIIDHAKRMMPYWQKKVQALAASGEDMNNPAKYQEHFQNWLSTEGFPGNKDFSSLGRINPANPTDVLNYLTKAVAMDMAGTATPKPGGAETTGDAPAAPAAQPSPAPAAAPAAPAPKFNSPQQVVDSMIKSLPPDWLPAITAELLKRQKVGATPK